MDMEVVGRHALLFDDDATAAFVNSSDALVDWNSLLIDRYDVRHLLSSPPPPRKRRNPQQTHSPPPSASSIEFELDHERFLDLPPPSDEQETDEGAKPDAAEGYHNVAFSYGNTEDLANQKDSDDGQGSSGFRPPFPVPESLLQSLPPTEKVHQIIARTAVFVSKHGGQSEIVLRVKQGDNPTFGFLMPDHHLHAYFRFLIDHQDLVKSGTDGKTETEKKGNTESNQTDGVVAGALSLLGSVYGSGEDEDGADRDGEVEGVPESKQISSGKTFDASDGTVSVGFAKTDISRNIDGKVDCVPESKQISSGKTFDASDGTVSVGFVKTDIARNIDGKNGAFAKHSSISKEKFQIPKRNSFASAPKSGTTNSTKKVETSSVLSTAVDISQPSAVSNLSQTEQLILEPPSDLKKLVDKIVEFIIRNGKQFEAVLLEQDSKHGRFPFLLQSSQYHPYYVKVLQKAQQLKLTGKSFISEEDDSVMNGLDKKTRLSKGSDSLSSGSAGYDIPYDADRKEKFRMVIGKSKKDEQDPPSKATQPQFGVNVDAAAAILQAATRGIKNPNFGFFSKTTSLNGDSNGRNSEGEIRKSGDNSASGPVAKDIAKTAALEAANEADSSEAHLTKEQRMKAERLKRAKMFVAMLKSGAAPGKTEPLRGLSVEPQETGVSTSGNVVFNLAAKGKEGIYFPVDVKSSAKTEKSEKKYSDEYQERRSKRKYRSKSALDEGGLQEDEVDDGEGEVEEEKEKDHNKSRKKHRSRRSSREEGEEEEDKEERDYRYARRKHRFHHSSRKDDEDERDRKRSRKKHQSYRSSEDDEKEEDYEDERVHKRSRKKHRSYRSSEDDEKEEDYEDERVHKHSRKKHQSHRSSKEDDDEEDYEEERNRKHSRKKSKSRSSSRHNRDSHKHKERHHSSSKNKHESSSDEEHLHRDSSDKHRKISPSEEELEEGEISSKMSDKSRGRVGAGVSREASLDVSSSYRDGRAPSQPSEATEIPDDLRAKIRAMLMATL